IKFPNPASRYAMVGVFVAKHKAGVQVAVTGAKAGIYREKAIEQALDKNFSEKALDNIIIDSSDLNSDIHASADYRASLIISSAKQAVAHCK
ncbi:MAG: carbon monoxide dehydrogenase, partial [Proteobacteria bacterium]|nr:carbon monoxide dehydrogenase [Pseudomonadota bacterium]